MLQNLGAGDLTLFAEERLRRDKVSEVALPYPYWHQAATASDRLSPADLLLIAPFLDA